MSGVLAPPNRDDYPTEGAWAFAQSIYGLLTGQSSWGVAIDHVGVDDDARYALTVQNQGSGGHINVPGLLIVDSGGISTGALTTTNLTATDLTVTDQSNLTDLDVSGGATVVDLTASGTVAADALDADTLDVGTLATIDQLNVTGSGNALEVTNNALVNGIATLGVLAVSTNASVLGNTDLGNGDGDALTVIGVSTFKNAAGSLTQLFVDAANNRVIVGSAAALASAANDTFTVAGGTAYFAGPSGSAIGIRYSAAETVGWLVGVDGSGANKDLLFLDDAGAEIIRFGDTSSTYQLRVTGDMRVTDDSFLDSDVEIGGNLLGTSGTFDWQNSGNSRLKINSTGIGLFGATPIARPTVTGVRTGTLGQLQAAFASLLSALDGSHLGAINDLTT